MPDLIQQACLDKHIQSRTGGSQTKQWRSLTVIDCSQARKASAQDGSAKPAGDDSELPSALAQAAQSSFQVLSR